MLIKFIQSLPDHSKILIILFGVVVLFIVGLLPHSFFWIILKMILAVCLLVAMGIAALFGTIKEAEPKKMLILYGVCLVICIGLGFSGGELQYG